MTEKNSIDEAIAKIDEQIASHRSASRRLLSIVYIVGILLLASGVGVYLYQGYMFSKSIGSWTGSYLQNMPFSSNGAIPTNPLQNPVQINSSTSNSVPNSASSGQPNGLSSALPNQGSSQGVGAVGTSVGTSGALPNQGFSQGGISVGASIGGGAPSAQILYVFAALFSVVFGVLMAIYRFHLSEISRSEQYRLGLHRIRIAANNHDKEGFNSEVRISLTQGAFDFNSGKEKKVESPLPGHPASDIGSLLTNKFLETIDIKVTNKP